MFYRQERKSVDTTCINNMHILFSSFSSMFLFNITVFYIVLFMLHFLACPYIFVNDSICSTTHTYMIYCQYLLLISESVCIYCLLNLMSMCLVKICYMVCPEVTINYLDFEILIYLQLNDVK